MSDNALLTPLMAPLPLIHHHLQHTMSYADFYRACVDGRLNTAKRLVAEFGLTATDARANDTAVLFWACANGHLEVAQWLVAKFGLTSADARADDTAVLRASCMHGHLEVVQWLHTTFALTAADARNWNYQALRWACEGDYPKLARWLVETYALTAENFETIKLFIKHKDSPYNNQIIERLVAAFEYRMV